MDPYLEGEMWSEFQARLAGEISRQLMPLLRPKYVALLHKRLVMDQLEEVPILSVEVRDTAERRLVTVIEILSPVNKRGSGFQDYLQKRLSLMQTQTHLLEIDLLRMGERIPLSGGELPSAAYYVFLSRFTRRPRTEVWPIQLQDALPTVPVPLLPPDEDVPLNLQQAVDDCFAVVGYEDLLDYSQPPPSPGLNEAEAAWLELIMANRVGQR
jgi:hypothetical protein